MSDGLVHEHFIIDASLDKPLDFTKRKEITTNLINQLLKTLKMHPLGPLEIYDAIDQNYPGWSFIQPITTSHISGHYFEEKKKSCHIHLDIYSCKEFDWKMVVTTLYSKLSISLWSANLIQREIDKLDRIILTLHGRGIDY